LRIHSLQLKFSEFAMTQVNVAEPEGLQHKSHTSKLAVASPVLALSGVCSFFGLIAGVIALVKIGSSQGRLRGNGLAIAGICISGMMMLFSLAVVPALLLPVLARARESAKRAASAGNMKQIYYAAKASATEKGGDDFPSDPYTLYPKYIDDPRAFRCQRFPTASTGYVYLSGIQESTGDAVLLYENVPSDVSSPGRNVLTANGSVEFVPEAHFRDMLDQTKRMTQSAGHPVREIPIDTTQFK
jgi:hypothetical protein